MRGSSQTRAKAIERCGPQFPATCASVGGLAKTQQRAGLPINAEVDNIDD